MTSMRTIRMSAEKHGVPTTRQKMPESPVRTCSTQPVRVRDEPTDLGRFCGGVLVAG